MSLVTIALRIARTTSGVARAFRARMIRLGRRSSCAATSTPPTNFGKYRPTGTARAAAPITQT